MLKIRIPADNIGKETPEQRAERIRLTNNGLTMGTRIINNKKYRKAKYNSLEED